MAVRLSVERADNVSVNIKIHQTELADLINIVSPWQGSRPHSYIALYPNRGLRVVAKFSFMRLGVVSLNLRNLGR